MFSKRISFVIPCYKSREKLDELVVSILSTYSKSNFEIILVCDDPDASTDSTWDRIKKLCQQSSKIRCFLLGKNYGQHMATLYGIQQSSGEIVVTMDDDGQHLTPEVSRLLNELEKGFDVVYGQARINEHGKIRNFLSIFFKELITITKLSSRGNSISSFRAFKKEIISEHDITNNYSGTVDAILEWRTNRITSVKIEMLKRKGSKSNYTFFSLFRYSLDMASRTSDALMVLIIYLGMLGSFISLVLMVFILIAYFTGKILVPGYTSIILSIAFSSSLGFSLLGLIGRLSSLNYLKLNGKDLIWVREKIDSNIIQ